MLYQSNKYTFLLIILLASLATPGQASQEKTAVFIIGMGRSGTSCTAGVLKILGLEMGSPLAVPRPNNEKGKFEHVPTSNFMQPILKEFDTIWFRARLIDWENVPQRERLKNEVKAHLDKYFGTYKFFGIKNPEITILLPLFAQAAQELGYTVKIIMVLRHPDETNASMKKDLKVHYPKPDYYKEISLAYACAFRNSQGLDMHVIYFNDLIQNTKETVEKLQKFLPQLKSYTSVQQELTNFIDEGLKHHNAKE